MNTSEHAGNVNGDNQTALDKPVWGAARIGEIINRTPRQAHHLLTRGLIKSARKVGNQWVANAGALRREFGA
jgi:hypothetical protein